MSPQEFWLIADAMAPEESIGKVKKSTFDRLKGMLENA